MHENSGGDHGLSLPPPRCRRPWLLINVFGLVFCRALWHSSSGVARGASGGYAPWGSPAHFLQAFKSRNVEQSVLKNVYFLEKDVKNRLNVGGKAPETPVGLQRLGAPPPDPRDVTPVCYYIVVKFISSTKCGLLPSKKNKFCIFQIFAAIFHFKFYSFCWQGAQKCFLPQGAEYPNYATA